MLDFKLDEMPIPCSPSVMHSFMDIQKYLQGLMPSPSDPGSQKLGIYGLGCKGFGSLCQTLCRAGGHSSLVLTCL